MFTCAKILKSNNPNKSEVYMPLIMSMLSFEPQNLGLQRQKESCLWNI
jgi:hypothetical protein